MNEEYNLIDNNTIKILENKEFKYFKENKYKILKSLYDKGIRKIILFEGLNKSFEDYEYEENTLILFPLHKEVVYRDSRERLTGYNGEEYIDLQLRPTDHYLSMIRNDCIDKELTSVLYSSLNKLLIPKMNIFKREECFNYFMEEIKSFDLETRSKEEIIKDNINKFFNVSVEKKIKDLEYRKNRAISEIETIEQRKEMIEGSIRGCETEIETLKETENEDKYNELIEVIKNCPLIKEYEIGLNRISISFGNIILKDKHIVGKEEINNITVPIIEDIEVDLGKIMIDMNIDISSNRAMFGLRTDKNILDNNVHPHGKTDMVCFGELNTDIYDCAEGGNFKQLIRLLHAWIFSYNPEDCYKKLGIFYEHYVNGGNENGSQED